jgi:site-specific DNA-methyltransferase (adenine-specific)
MELNKIYNMDCLEGMKEIPTGSVDMILTDLPFGTTACKWDVVIPFDLLWEQYNRVIKDNGAIVLFGNEPFSSNLRMSNIDNYKYDLKWVKPNSTSPNLAKKQPLRRYEDIMIFYKKQPIYNPQMTEGKPYKWNSKRSGGESSNISFEKDREIDNKGTRYPTNILEFKQERGLHVNQKPIKLLEWLIKTYSDEGHTVLDSCSGSGSTAVACKNTKRNFISFETDKKYFDLSIKRLGEII